MEILFGMVMTLFFMMLIILIITGCIDFIRYIAKRKRRRKNRWKGIEPLKPWPRPDNYTHERSEPTIPPPQSR